jgi:fructosamine-3-kinase
MYTVLSEEMKKEVEAYVGTPYTLSYLTSGQVGPVYRIRGTGGDFLLKTSDASDILPTEAKMLRDMAQAGVRVPEVYASSDDFLLMRFIDTPASVAYDRDIAAAETLLKLHSVSNDARMYGYYYDTPIASFWQRNEQTQYNWALFYGQMRLLPMARICYDKDYVSAAHIARLEALARDLYARIDMRAITPSLLHGDIWSGNILMTTKGRC